MEIDVILILNLEHRPDRLWATWGALVAAGTPINRIRRFEATLGSDFKDLDALIHAATEDGFPQMSYLVIDLPADSPDYQMELNIKTQTWNYCQMLRYLVETKQTGLILYDDRYIKKWDTLEGIYRSLRQMQPGNDRLILQLDYYFSPHLNQKAQRHRHSVPYIIEGPFSGSDNAMLFSAAGAEWFLSKVLEKENKHRNIEDTILRLSFLLREKCSDFWSCDCDIAGKMPYLGSDIRDSHIDNGFKIQTINK